MRVAIDMDGTIADFTTPFKENIYKLYGIPCEEGYIDAKSIYEALSPERKAKYNNHYELYGDLCGPGFFLNLRPYPGAIEAVNRIFDAGHEVIFLTKPLNWDRSAPEKAQWLKKYFPDRKYKLIMTNSASSKGLLNVDVIVDDDKRVLEAPTTATMICIAQSWNKDFRENLNNCYLPIADSFVEAANIILDEIASATDEWNRVWSER